MRITLLTGFLRRSLLMASCTSSGCLTPMYRRLILLLRAWPVSNCPCCCSCCFCCSCAANSRRSSAINASSKLKSDDFSSSVKNFINSITDQFPENTDNFLWIFYTNQIKWSLLHFFISYAFQLFFFSNQTNEYKSTILKRELIYIYIY